MNNKAAIIDDDKWFLSYAHHIFVKFGLEVDCYHAPHEYESFIFNTKLDVYDAIMIDHNLGDMNGADLAKKLLSKSLKAKIILISGMMIKNYQGLDYYKEKLELLKDPTVIFKGDNNVINQAVEMSVLAQVSLPYPMSYVATAK